MSQTEEVKVLKPKRTPPRLTQVLRTYDVSPAIRRVVLGGEALREFPADRNGAHIKVFLPLAGQAQPVLPKLGPKGPVWPPQHVRPITRTYSVRHYCAAKNELAVDFVLHGDDSPAAGWANSAKPGDFLGIAGPGGPNPLLAPAVHHVLVGDLTALPAIAALLELLDENAHALVFLWVPEDKEAAHKAMTLHHPSGVKIVWLSSAQNQCTSCVLQAVQQQVPKAWQGDLSAFIAGENSLVLNVRQFLCDEFNLNKSLMYATPYWRYGQDEETYHQERHRIMDQIY